jgi:SAM-dependent methyltransferase
MKYIQIRERIAKAIARRWDRNRYPKTGKADIINALGHANNYSVYLEVASRITGHKFSDISERIFTTKQRVLYNVPDDYSDGLPVQYTSTKLNGEVCLQQIVDSGQTFDVVFVDPYHSFEASKIDLEYGYKLLKPGGVLVVHDCNPPDQDLTSADYHGGYWLGQTYLAFLDFVAQRPELEYCVVDTDWGVGLIFRSKGDKPKRRGRLPRRPDIDCFDVRTWKDFDHYRKRILRLISVRRFFKYFVS